jgi:UDP-N-acetylmuramate: L-alanyl-gamma-D-glutamyl-meso-diaminopimelate ligase
MTKLAFSISTKLNNMNKLIHFIGINDPIMCHLAISLQQQGYQVSASADVLAEPIQEQIKQANLLPKELGWFSNKLTKAVEKVIISRELPADNPELQAALQLGIHVDAYSQYIYHYAQDKQRIVITGGSEATYVCAVAMHVLRYWHRTFDYVLNEPMPGWDRWVRLTNAPIILLQADALPTSVLDKTPQFLTYQHHIALISGISEERGNVYATIDDYLKYLEALADATPKGGILIYNQEVALLKELGTKPRTDVKTLAFQPFTEHYKGSQAYLTTPQKNITIASIDPMQLQSIAAAQLLLKNIGIDEQKFYEAIPSFSME